MRKFNLFRPFRTILVLYQQGYCFYRFRFGKCIEKKFAQEHSELALLNLRTELLIACPVQDIYFEQTPPLKYFDRPSFIFHALSYRFKTTKWIAARWLTSKSFTGFKFSDVPENSLKEFKGTCGAFLGELGRLSLFDTQEGCLLASGKSGQLYQIYIKDDQIYFVRSIAFEDFNITTDLDILRRHLERYYQTNLQTLEIKWWGPYAPPGIDVYEEKDFEESLVQNYIRYSRPLLECYPQLTPKFFRWQELNQKLKIVGVVAGAFLWFFCLFNIYEMLEIEKHHRKLHQAFENQQKIYQNLTRDKPSPELVVRQEYYKKHVECLNFLIPLAKLPWEQLEKISHHVKKDLRCHELIWLRGQIQFHLTDHSFELQPHVFEKQLASQSFIIAVTSSYVSSLENFDCFLRKELGQGVEIKSWYHTRSSGPTKVHYPVQKSTEDVIPCLFQIIQKS